MQMIYKEGVIAQLGDLEGLLGGYVYTVIYERHCPIGSQSPDSEGEDHEGNGDDSGASLFWYGHGRR